MGLREATAYAERVIGTPSDEWRAIPLTPADQQAALWPLNEIFRPRLMAIRTFAYRLRFETEADAAILSFADSPTASTWAALTTGAWRVLLERHTQMLMVAGANEAAGERTMGFIPEALPDAARLPFAMLCWLHGMKLPWKPRDLGSLELPEAGPPVPLRLH